MSSATEFRLTDAVVLLSRTPAALDALLRGLPDSWTHANEGEGTWSAFDIVGHLIEGEHSDWIPRARIILESGESRPFTPFDRGAQFERNRGKTLHQLLDEFARARRESLSALAALNLKPEDLERRGTHPKFGSVTLAQLLATWTVHDLNHLHQLARVLAGQYREAVGPWTAFLGVMHCDAHSG